jgi:hypothetical protein
VRRLTPRNNASPTLSRETTQQDGSSGLANGNSVISETQSRHQHHFAFAGNSYRYLGSESCLLKSPRLCPRTVRSPLKLDDDDDDWHLSWKKLPAKEFELLGLYLEVIQPVFPILDMTLPYLTQEAPVQTSGTEKFSLNMIYSIACYILPSTGKKGKTEDLWNPSGRLSYHQANWLKYRTLAGEYFTDAMKYLEEATVEPSLATLRAVLLLAIHSSFDPKSGNMGQQIALAARLEFDLKAKGELQELQPNEVIMLRNMHMTIFTLENQVASTLDRPALFPEPVRMLVGSHIIISDHEAGHRAQFRKIQPCRVHVLSISLAEPIPKR